MSTKNQPRRSWRRFTLRSLFVVVTIICVLLAWRVHVTGRQERACARIRELYKDRIPSGGRDSSFFTYVHAFDEQRYGSPFPFREPVTGGETWWDRMQLSKYTTTIVGLDLSLAKNTGACLETAKVFSDLESLDLWHAQVTDDDLRHLQGLPLKRVEMSGAAGITDRGLEHLGAITTIEYLNVYGTKVTDSGLKHLQRLPKLEHLDLGRTAVTDAGVERLGKMTSLKTIYLHGSKVTAEGVQRLRTLLPGRKIAN